MAAIAAPTLYRPVERRRGHERARDLDRLVPVHAEPAGRTARVVGVAGLEEARAEIAREGVVGPAGDRDAGAQTERVGGGPGQVADDGAHRDHRWPAVDVQAGRLRHHGRVGDGLVGHERRDGLAGQAEGQPLPGREVPAGPRRDIGLVALQPQGGRQRTERPAADARRGSELVGLGRRRAYRGR